MEGSEIGGVEVRACRQEESKGEDLGERNYITEIHERIHEEKDNQEELLW